MRVADVVAAVDAESVGERSEGSEDEDDEDEDDETGHCDGPYAGDW